MSEELKLLPCPFCGEKPKYKTYMDACISVSCMNCGIGFGYFGDKEESNKEAIEKWNTRHYPPEVEKAVERMKPVVIKPEKTDEYHPDGSVYLIKCENCKQEYKFIGFEFSNAIQHCGKCGQAHLLDWDEDGRIDTALQKP